MTRRAIYPQVVGPTPVTYRVGAWVDTALFCGIYLAVSISNSEGQGLFYYIRWAPAILPGVFLMRLLATTRIEVQGSKIRLINLFTERVVSRNAIGDLEGENGIALRLKNGKALSSFAYGFSVAQTFVRSRSSESVYFRILKWADQNVSDDSLPMVSKLSIRSEWPILLAQSCVIVAITATIACLTGDVLRDWINSP